MTAAQTVSSAVDVAVDPATAFHAFTAELDLWWLRGPINFWSDGGRVVEVRCEPGVGGRIVEVLDEAYEILKDPHQRDMQAIANMPTACMDSDDFREGRRAFMEKRPPRFVGSA